MTETSYADRYLAMRDEEPLFLKVLRSNPSMAAEFGMDGFTPPEPAVELVTSAGKLPVRIPGEALARLNDGETPDPASPAQALEPAEEREPEEAAEPVAAAQPAWLQQMHDDLAPISGPVVEPSRPDVTPPPVVAAPLAELPPQDEPASGAGSEATSPVAEPLPEPADETTEADVRIASADSIAPIVDAVTEEAAPGATSVLPVTETPAEMVPAVEDGDPQ